MWSGKPFLRRWIVSQNLDDEDPGNFPCRATLGTDLACPRRREIMCVTRVWWMRCEGLRWGHRGRKGPVTWSQEPLHSSPSRLSGLPQCWHRWSRTTLWDSPAHSWAGKGAGESSCRGSELRLRTRLAPPQAGGGMAEFCLSSSGNSNPHPPPHPPTLPGADIPCLAWPRDSRAHY